MKQAIKEAIYLTAQYYGLDMRADVLAMYAEDLADLPPQAVLDAYKAYRRDPANIKPPLPAQIRRMLNPEANNKQHAQEIAQRCFGAIRKFGYTKPQQAKEYIGELGWRLIERRGGWFSHCQNTMESDIPILTAQFRDSLTSYVEQGERQDSEYFNKARIEFNETTKLLPEMPKCETLTDEELNVRKQEVLKSFMEELKKKNTSFTS
jgi:hypothetical protein